MTAEMIAGIATYLGMGIWAALLSRDIEQDPELTTGERKIVVAITMLMALLAWPLLLLAGLVKRLLR